MNIKGPKGRGAYSAILFKEGTTIVAEDAEGTIIKKNSDAKTVIQAANDALAASGGEIWISDEAFDITSPIAPSSNVTIKGQGISTVLTNISSAWQAIFSIVGTEGSEKKNVTISNLKLIGNKTADQGPHIDMKHCHYCKINNCWFDECKVDGIEAENIKYCVMCDNVFDDNEEGITIDNCDFNTISHNVVSCRSSGIFLDTCDFNKISDNIIKDQAWHGVFLFGACNKNVVKGNICHGSTMGIGISVYGTAGVGPCENTITGNSCCDNLEGITLDLDCCQNTIAGNVCDANISNTGIELNGRSQRNIICGNQCCDNLGSVGVGSEGIHIGADADNNVISGNMSCGNDYGILIAAYTAGKNLVDSNILLNNGTANLSDLGSATVMGDNIVS